MLNLSRARRTKEQRRRHAARDKKLNRAIAKHGVAAAKEHPINKPQNAPGSRRKGGGAIQRPYRAQLPRSPISRAAVTRAGAGKISAPTKKKARLLAKRAMKVSPIHALRPVPAMSPTMRSEVHAPAIAAREEARRRVGGGHGDLSRAAALRRYLNLWSSAGSSVLTTRPAKSSGGNIFHYTPASDSPDK